MNRRRRLYALVPLAALLVALAPRGAGASAVPPQGTQSDAAFAASYAANSVTKVSATSRRTSCYAPELTYFESLTPSDGYPDGGMSPCNGAATTGEDPPFHQQQVVAKIRTP